MKIVMIRHGMTKGNLEKRYVGSTDEGLCDEGRQALILRREDIVTGIGNHCGISYWQSCEYGEYESRPQAWQMKLYVSPMLRCQETASLLFPNKEQQVVSEFSEMNFGEFEYKNYQELNGQAAYQRWIDEGGTGAFPGGESRAVYQARVLRGFRRILRPYVEDSADSTPVAHNEDIVLVLVVHAGTIMSILDEYTEGSYFDYQVKPGEGYILDLSTRSCIAL